MLDSKWVQYALRASPYGVYDNDRAAMILPSRVVYVSPDIREHDNADLLYYYLLASERSLDLFASFNRVGAWLDSNLIYLTHLAQCSLLAFASRTRGNDIAIDARSFRDCHELWQKFLLIWNSGCLLDETFELFFIKYCQEAMHFLMRRLYASGNGGVIDLNAQNRIRDCVREMANEVDRTVRDSPAHLKAHRLLGKLVKRSHGDVERVHRKLYEAAAIFVEEIDLFCLSTEELQSLLDKKPQRYHRDYRLQQLADGKPVEVATIPVYTRKQLEQEEKNLFVQYHENMPAISIKEKFLTLPPSSFFVTFDTSYGTVTTLLNGPFTKERSLDTARLKLLQLLHLITALAFAGERPFPDKLIQSINEALEWAEGRSSNSAIETLTSSGRRLAFAFFRIVYNARMLARLNKTLVVTPSLLREREELAATLSQQVDLYQRWATDVEEAVHELNCHQKFFDSPEEGLIFSAEPASSPKDISRRED